MHQPLIAPLLFVTAANQLEHAFASPTAEGACDDGGAGVAVPLASGNAGVRACGALVSYVTNIPADLDGVLYATLTVFLGDGTGVGITGRVNSTIGPLGEIDAPRLSCGPLPEARATRPPIREPTTVLTPAPASSGDVAAADRAPPPTPRKPSLCVAAERSELQDVRETDAGPYFVHHPTPDIRTAPTVIFLPGGSGRRGSARRVWDNIFAGGSSTDAFRVVIPYSLEEDFIDGAARTFEILNEVLWCYGGDPAKVHLAGTSNGGLAAFALMASRPEHFATLLGAPGAFPVQDPTDVDPTVWADSWKTMVVASTRRWRSPASGLALACRRCGSEPRPSVVPFASRVSRATVPRSHWSCPWVRAAVLRGARHEDPDSR